MICIVFKEGIGACCARHASLFREPDLYPVVEGLIVGEMTVVELLIGVVLCMPYVVGGIFQIGSTFTDGMFAETIETAFVDDVENDFLCMGNCQGRVAGSCLTVGLYAHHRTEMDAFLRIACYMARHGELGRDGFHLMGHLSGEGNLAVDITSEADGDEFVRIRGKILALNHLTITQIAVFDDTAVKTEATMIVCDGT